MSATNRGKGWEARHSLWLILVFVMFLNWAAFFWIGASARQRKWLLFGCLYLVLCFVVPVGGVAIFSDDSAMSDAAIIIFLIAWIACIVHAFICRKEYLQKLEAIVAREELAATLPLPQRQPNTTQANTVQLDPIPQAAPLSAPAPQPPPPLEKIDLNTANEQQLAALPGVGVALAKKAVVLRAQFGSYKSAQDFCARLELMPHFAVQIGELAFAAPPEEPAPVLENKGRVVDI